MFGKRVDGRRIKDISPFMKMIPYIMKMRIDSQNLMKQEIDCSPLDDYIKQKRSENIHLTYMDIVVCAMVRTFALRPQLNRFVMNGRIYARKKIWFSLVIKKALRDEAEETAIKLPFSGLENIFDISESMNAEISKNKGKDKTSEADSIVNIIGSAPGSLIKLIVFLCRFLDRHNMLPKVFIDASPFHTSFFLTNLKSINLDSIYHHVYEFGTTGLFISMGKEKKMPVVDYDAQVVVKKILPLNFVIDERCCDGLYYANSLKLFKRYLNHPRLLEERLLRVIPDKD